MATRFCGINEGQKKTDVVIQTSGTTSKKIELAYDTSVPYQHVINGVENILAALKEAKVP